MVHLEEIEAIKKLKYKYLRCIDTKSWDEITQCFVEDATTSYDSGTYSYQGRDAIIKFLSETLAPTMITTHHSHGPEIDITSENTATGIWRLEDYNIVTEMNLSMHGAVIHHDEYVKVKGEWKIKHTGYERIFMEMWDRGDVPSLKLTHNMWGPTTETT